MAFLWKICFAVILALHSQVHAQKKKMTIEDILGPYRDVEQDSELARITLQFVKDEYNKDRTDGNIIEIRRINELKQQVSAGSVFSVDVEALVSVCFEKDPATGECQNHRKMKKRCKFYVEIILWHEHKRMLSGICR
ncbi:cystatin-SA-like [Leptodactylus fuscus]|uniref:cystatin-SA-like n=1 Tax=Leptodactylus fuscus TaxID=238119 RepID=UPI003F4E9DF8